MPWSFTTVVLAPRAGRAVPSDAAERARIFAWAAQTGFTGVELNPRWYDTLTLTERDLGDLRRTFGDRRAWAGWSCCSPSG